MSCYDLMPRYGKIVLLYFLKLYTIQGTEVGIFNFSNFLFIIFWGGSIFFRPGFCWMAIHSVKHMDMGSTWLFQTWEFTLSPWVNKYLKIKCCMIREGLFPPKGWSCQIALSRWPPHYFLSTQWLSIPYYTIIAVIIINHLLNRRETKQWLKYFPSHLYSCITVFLVLFCYLYKGPNCSFKRRTAVFCLRQWKTFLEIDGGDSYTIL